MNDRVKIAIIAAIAVIGAVFVYSSYLSPYNSCVRGFVSGGAAQNQASFQCARQLGASGK